MNDSGVIPGGKLRGLGPFPRVPRPASFGRRWEEISPPSEGWRPLPAYEGRRPTAESGEAPARETNLTQRDAASQQTGEHTKPVGPASPIQLLDPIPADWLERFDRTEQARALEEYQHRLAADETLVLDLQWEGFAGPRWEALATALAEYGWQVMTAWIITGEVFVKCRQKRLAGAVPTEFQRERAKAEVEELAQATVAYAIIAFRDRVLKPHLWNAAGGATLKTFFIGQCLIQFVTVFRTWARSVEPIEPLEALERQVDCSPRFDPAACTIDRIEIARGLEAIGDRVTRSILVLSAQGYAQDEIAELLQLPSAKAVESKIYRHRKRQ